MPGAASPGPRYVRCHLFGQEVGRRGELFHSHTNRCHHARSDWNSLYRRIGCGFRGCMGMECRRSIIRLRNGWPAWFISPISDSNPRLGHAFLSPHSSRHAWRRCILSAGSRSWDASVSISILRNVRQDVGPSRFVLCNRYAQGRTRLVEHAHCLSSFGRTRWTHYDKIIQVMEDVSDPLPVQVPL